MTVRAVLLDAGNTILHVDHAFVARAIREAGGDVSPEEVRRAEIHARVRLDPHLRRGSTESVDVRRVYFGLVLEEMRGRPPADPERVVAALIARGQLWSVPDPDARHAIDELRRRGLRVGVVSNSDGHIEEWLERVGLREGLDVVVDSGIAGVEKPDPRIFGIALRALDLPASEVVYVGDLPAIDLEGARAAGLGFVLVDPLGLWPAAIDAPRIRGIGELPDLVARRA